MKANAFGGIAKRVLLALLVVIFLIAITSNGVNTDVENVFIGPSSIAQDYAVLESKGGTYFGPVLDLVYSGNGEFQHLDGGVYEGQFENSKREGEGTFTWANGDKFEGHWENDKITSGTYTFADGRVFSGSFIDNKFMNGTLLAQKSESVPNLTSLAAIIKSGSIDSLTIEMQDGTRYSGQITGEADIHYPSGNEYSGSVVNGVRSGTGTFNWVENGEIRAHYLGTWKDGLMSGSGTYYYSAGVYPNIHGTFSEGKPTGTLTYYKEAGNTFATQWDNGTCTSVTET